MRCSPVSDTHKEKDKRVYVPVVKDIIDEVDEVEPSV